MTELRLEKLSIPGAPLQAENPLPIFRHPRVDRAVHMMDGVPDDKRNFFGWQTGYRVLPYRLQDQYSRKREMLDFQVVVLENEFLQATFLPSMGGRLLSLIDKKAARELLHRNPVFQPANLAIRNAWFSGGIEWNIGQYGHTFTTCAPVFTAAIQGDQGEPGLRIYEYERCKGLLWQVDFYLPPGFPFLVAYTRVVNPDDDAASMYWWTNIAVNEAPGVRVLASASQALYVDFSDGRAAFGMAKLPILPSLNGADGTYSLNSTFANEFFFQCDQAEIPWEAALDQDGYGLIEVSTDRLKYRKLFCWGTHPGGRHWQEFLSEPGQAYLEIQAGLAPTQLHGLPMAGRSSWDWMQVFGALSVNPKDAHHPDWSHATSSVTMALRERLPPDELYRIQAACQERADIASHVLLQIGSGWGALELRRNLKTSSMALPEAFYFPESSLGVEQRRWLELLDHNRFLSQAPGDLPGEWMVQQEWERLLEASPAKDWYAWLHLGVMRLERFDEKGAEAAWEESLRQVPSAWAYRNLAVLHLRQGKTAQALGDYRASWQAALETGCASAALAVEVMQTLIEAQEHRLAQEVYQSLAPDLRQNERLQILRAQAALALGDLDVVDEVLAHEFAGVREGETVLTDLWFESHLQREALKTGIPPHQGLMQEIRKRYPPPARIDFRSIND